MNGFYAESADRTLLQTAVIPGCVFRGSGWCMQCVSLSGRGNNGLLYQVSEEPLEFSISFIFSNFGLDIF